MGGCLSDTSRDGDAGVAQERRVIDLELWNIGGGKRPRNAGGAQSSEAAGPPGKRPRVLDFDNESTTGAGEGEMAAGLIYRRHHIPRA
jgi:hypothetical protein